MYKCEIIADSISPQKHRITTFKVTYPRVVHAEMLRSRMLSRNVASSRAIPFTKMVKMVEENPFIPIAWQKDHKGMQGTEYFTDDLSIQFATSNWLSARDNAVKGAMSLHSTDNGYGSVTKQLCNRLLEPFVWTTELISGTEWDNFFELRCPKYQWEKSEPIFKSKKDYMNYYPGSFEHFTDMTWYSLNKSQADIHIQAIAEMMWDAMDESTPKQLEAGEFHIPFGDNIDLQDWYNSNKRPTAAFWNELEDYEKDSWDIKIATARCARISYETLGDDPKIDYEADIKLHDRLLEQKHMSPFEHCAKAMSNDEYNSFYRGKLNLLTLGGECDLSANTDEDSVGWCRNFRGFIPYRHLVE